MSDKPASFTPDTPRPFELGLVTAGAVSAGAYTAGVLDLLFEAMDGFEAAQEAGDPETPTHKVVLRAIVGASAGAMNAAILAAWARRAFPPVTHRSIGDAETRRRNPFAWAWIDQPHITRLLDTSDMAGGTLPSAMNGAWLEKVVQQVLSPREGDGLRPAEAPRERAWLRELRVRLTVGNLTGTPYELRFPDSAKPAGGMMDHAEVMDFLAVPGPDAKRTHYLPLAGEPSNEDKTWRALGDAALASGAFPAALPARQLHRPPEERAPRLVFVPAGDPDNPDAGRWETLPASWSVLEPDRATLLCVDGGIANNEPIDLCREALLLKGGARLLRDAAEADRAMIMVDPFPDGPICGPQSADTPLARILGALIGAWKNQARFQPVDLWLATRGDAFSRHLIAPSIEPGTRPEGAPELAGDALGGFFGFFHENFRRHDYLLGRHNCRSFLQRHFTVPVCNPVVRHWAEAEGGGPTPLALRVMEAHGLDPAKLRVPLIPLPAHLREPPAGAEDPVPQPEWPAGVFDPEALRPMLVARAREALKLAAKGQGFGIRAGLRLFRGRLAAAAADRAIATLIEARTKSRL